MGDKSAAAAAGVPPAPQTSVSDQRQFLDSELLALREKKRLLVFVADCAPKKNSGDKILTWSEKVFINRELRDLAANGRAVWINVRSAAAREWCARHIVGRNGIIIVSVYTRSNKQRFLTEVNPTVIVKAKHLFEQNGNVTGDWAEVLRFLSNRFPTAGGCFSQLFGCFRSKSTYNIRKN
jgi:hypothetical protein